MTQAGLAASARDDREPPAGLSSEVQALWHAKKGNWKEAHDIAQEIHTQTGSWIHALLHMIEGDMSNANYWFHRSGKPTRNASEIDAVWDEIEASLL